jgi:hypothetical protein
MDRKIDLFKYPLGAPFRYTISDVTHVEKISAFAVLAEVF